VALTARPCHPRPRRCQGAAPGRRAALAALAAQHQGRVPCVPAHGQGQHQHGQHQHGQHGQGQGQGQRVPCVPLWLYGTHGTRLRPCVSCGSCVPLFSNRSRAANVEVLHYSYCYYIQYIYFHRPIQIYDTHDTQEGFFREPDHTCANAHNVTHADTHTLRVNTYVVKSVTDQHATARARALARFFYALYVRGSSSLSPLHESTL